MSTYTLPQGSTLLLQGPAHLRLLGGNATSFAAPIPSDWISVEAWRQVPVYASETSVIEIRLGPGSSSREIRGSTLPTGWSEASEVLQQTLGVVVVIGDVDSGKSSLCTFLANEAIKRGLKVGIIDADVGQADLGPPTTITSSMAERPILDLQQLKPETSFFIGDTSPSSVPEKLIHFLVRLKDDLVSSSDIVLVNTDGWIADTLAARHKLRLLSETSPALILGLDKGGELDPILQLATGTILKLESSSFAKTRTKEDRKKARDASYKRFLNGSKLLKIGLGKVKLRMFDQPQQTLFAGSKDFRGLITGLLNADDSLDSIGRVKEFHGGTALVETHAQETPNVLELGSVRLSSRYEEAGYDPLH